MYDEHGREILEDEDGNLYTEDLGDAPYATLFVIGVVIVVATIIWMLA